jgi:hypothetical protein
MSQVVVLNASYERLHVVSVQHAVGMLVRGVAVIQEAHPEAMFGPFQRPLVLRLVRYVKMGWRYATSSRVAYSKAGVLRRDRGRCAYCGLAGATTMDHVLPRSRGGRTDWLNAVAAHQRCNAAKAARTPAEAGMTLLWTPWVPSPADVAFR